ncbi:MAG: flagellar hook-basal body complex protein [Solirubrobacteraceae bacterium]|nr:flagellar hook-basal body complex protein [Solirubrobacteraceae bacterium]
MERGLSIAASGMMAEMARQDQIANDLANATTAGYKSDRVSVGSFGELMVTDLATGKQVGSVTAGARVQKQVTDLRPNVLRSTEEPLDMAIQGAGYFAVQTPEGQRFTRGGNFQAGVDNTLVDQSGNKVLGPNRQPIKVDADGRVPASAVGVFAVPNARKAGDSYFNGNATGRDTGIVKTNATEASGTDAARTVVQMMASLRAIEAGQKAITTIDESLGKANTVGSLRG